MKIYTSYFAKVKQLPEGVVPVAICSGIPQWWDGLVYQKLAPQLETLETYRLVHDEEQYTESFEQTVLYRLTPDSVVNELQEMSGGLDVCILCYESPEKFCHRHLVAKWLTEAGHTVEEY